MPSIREAMSSIAGGVKQAGGGGAEAGQKAAQAVVGPPPTPPAPAPAQATPAQGLPPTGLDQQLETLNQTYQAVAQTPQVGFDVLAQQMQGGVAEALAVPGGGPGGGAGGAPTPGGSTNVQQMARNLAQNYGLAIGRGNIVDAQGNFLVTPDQLASASGDTIGETAAKMNYVSQALARQQTEQQQQKGIAAIQTGLGQVQERGRGSLASLQTGLYQDLADLYSNQEYQAADFSYFIQKEQMDIAQEMMRRQEKLAKKQSRMGFVGGIGMGIAGIASGNVAMGMGGFGTAVGSASGTGWF